MRPSTLRDWSPCPPIQRDGGRRSRPGVNPFISALAVARCPATFPGVRPHFGTLCPQVGTWDKGFSYTPCLLMERALCFRLSSPKQSLVFLPLQIPCPHRRQRHFYSDAGRAYNTLHFASQSRVPRGKSLRKPRTTKQAEHPALSYA